MLQGSVPIGFNNVLGLSVKLIMFFLSDHNNVAQQIPFMEQPTWLQQVCNPCVQNGRQFPKSATWNGWH